MEGKEFPLQMVISTSFSAFTLFSLSRSPNLPPDVIERRKGKLSITLGEKGEISLSLFIQGQGHKCVPSVTIRCCAFLDSP